MSIYRSARFVLCNRIELRGVVCYRYDRHKEGVAGANLEEIDWAALKRTPRCTTKHFASL